MSILEVKNITEIIQHCLISCSILIGAIWAIYQFWLYRNKYGNINLTSDIIVIGQKEDCLLIELFAQISNVSKVQHKMKNFTYLLSGIHQQDTIKHGVVEFKEIINGSYISEKANYYFVDANSTVNYSRIICVPLDYQFLNLLVRSDYLNRRNCTLKSAKTIKIHI